MENHLPLIELAYLAEGMRGRVATQGKGIIFTLPPEADSNASKTAIDFPETTDPNEIRIWAFQRAKQLEELVTHALAEAAKLDEVRQGITERLINVLEAHCREGMGSSVDLAAIHYKVFGFNLALVDHTTALTDHRELLGSQNGDPVFVAANLFEGTLPSFTTPQERLQNVEQTLKRCILAAENLIDSMDFSPEKTAAIMAKIRKIKWEVRENVTYMGKASLEGQDVNMILKPQAGIAQQQLTVIHEFTHALQIIMRQFGFEEDILYFENLVSVAGSGSVALDEGLADLHSHGVLQRYSPNKDLLNPHDDLIAAHWHLSFLRRQILNVKLAAARQAWANDEALRKLILDQEYSPNAAAHYLRIIGGQTLSTSSLYTLSNYHGGQLFTKRTAIDPARTVREFLHMEGGPNDYVSLAAK